MSEHLSAQQLERYRERTLPSADLLSADDHLMGCDACRRQAGHGGLIASLFESVRDGIEVPAEAAGGHLTFDQLADHVDHKMSTEAKIRVERHLSVCPPCAEELRELGAFRRTVFGHSTIAPVAAAPATSRGKGGALWLSPGYWTRVRGAAAASLALLLVGLASWLAWRMAQPPQTEVADLHRSPSGVAASPSSQETAADVATARSSMTPADTTTPTPQTTPAVEQAPPRVTLTLNDGNGSIALDDRGQLLGLESLPRPHRLAVRSALISGRAGLPAGLSGLTGRAGTLLGGGEGVSFALLRPVGTAVLTDQPAFSWRPLGGATGYSVNVYDSEFNKVAGSPPISATEWRVPQPLEGGKTYSWQVIAIKGGEEITSPRPPAPEARFKVPTKANLDELRRIEQLAAGSHLARGVIFLREGLLDDAEREFRALAAANPGSPVARKLLRQVQALRRPGE